MDAADAPATDDVVEGQTASAADDVHVSSRQKDGSGKSDLNAVVFSSDCIKNDSQSEFVATFRKV